MSSPSERYAKFRREQPHPVLADFRQLYDFALDDFQVRACEAVEDGPLVLGFLAARSRRCIDAVDALDDLRARFPDVAFAVVAIRGDRGDLRELVRDRGWVLPVAHDRDGAVANAYAVAVCPTVTFVRRGGEVEHTTLGATGMAELARHAAEAASRASERAALAAQEAAELTQRLRDEAVPSARRTLEAANAAEAEARFRYHDAAAAHEDPAAS